LPKDAPKPGKFRLRNGASDGGAPAGEAQVTVQEGA
jgi:hypothetical protein